MRVVHFERQPLPRVSGRTSIERLFASIRGALPSDCDTSVVRCPTIAHGSLPLLRGLFQAWRARSEVNHVVGDIHYAVLGLPRSRTVLTVHDSLHLDELHGVRRLLYRWLYFTWPLRWCATVTAISEDTRRQLVLRFPFAADRIRVIPDCYPPEFTPHPKAFREDHPTILQVGTRPGKNLERVAEALRGIPCLLKVVGRLSEEQTALLTRNRICYESRANLTDEEMLQAYIEADMLVFASLAEGFGMPIVEAQAIGRPLVTSRIEPMAEVAGEGACLVNPYDAGDIRRGILDIIRNRNYREAVVTGGLRNARRYSPAAVAAQYANLYREVASGRFSRGRRSE